MELKASLDIQHSESARTIQPEFWPLDAIDPKTDKYPCCLVWTPLPVVSWLAPFIGHVGICREDGAIIDFSGSNFVNVGGSAFGSVARYLQLDREQCCFPTNLATHTCKNGFTHADYGTAIAWDDALQSSKRESLGWNMINVATVVLLKGQWVNVRSVLRAFMPFMAVLSIGIMVVGWPFLIGLLSFSLLLMIWFLVGTYLLTNVLES